MPPSIIKNQTKEIIVTKARTPSPRKTLRKQRFQQVCLKKAFEWVCVLDLIFLFI